MARKANTFVFTNARTKYDWETWFNGDIWRLDPQDDFTVEEPQMRSNIYAAARRMGKSVRIQGKDGSLFIQAEDL